MFEQLKQFKQLNDLKSALDKERIEVEKNGVKIILNAKMEIEKVSLDPALSHSQIEESVKSCFNEAVQKIQRLVFEKMNQLKG